MKERQLMIAGSDCESGAFLMSGNRAADDDPSSQQYHIKKGRREVRIQPDFAKRLKMDYEQFKESFIEDLKAGLADKGFEDVSIKVNEVNKLNESYEAISVTPAGENIGINTNLETFFESYENGADYDAVVAKAVDTAIRGFDNAPAVDVASLTDYEQMKDKLAMEVVSTDSNAELLANIPHKEIEDMSVVYRFVLESNDDGRASILVTNQLIETMGVTPEQLHADALKTAPELKPAVIKGMSEVMAEMMGMSPEDLAMMGMPTDPADEQMYVATVPDKIHGAGIIAYQDFMDQASERIGGGDFFVLPSSLHEILIVPDNGQMGLRDLEAMVKEVNATQVAPEDKLTDSVYHYDSQAKVFELGEKFVERQAEKDAEKAEAKDSVLGELAAKKDEVAKAPKKETVEKAAKSKGGEAL